MPSPDDCLVISAILSRGKGGEETGFRAMDINFKGLSSAAIRLEESQPHRLQR